MKADLRSMGRQRGMEPRRATPQMSISGGPYEGANTDAYSNRYTMQQTSPDEELANGIPVLRARNADLVRNDPIAYGVIDTIAHGVVGRGPRLRSMASDETIRDTIDRLFREWTPRAHWDGVSSWADACNGIVHGSCLSGDVLAIWPDVGYGTGTRIDLVDARRIDTPSDKTPECASCRLGVGYDKYGRVLGYYVRKEEGSGPGRRDEFHWFPLTRNGRLNAFLFRRPGVSRPRQSRGVPLLAPAIHDLKDLRDYRRTEVRRAAQAAKVHTVIETPDPNAIAAAFENVDASVDETGAIDQLLGRSYGNTPDGSYMVLGMGEKASIANPPQTNGGAGDYMEAMLRAVAGCTGLPFEEAFRHFAKLNYSNARTLRTMARAVYRDWRDTMESGICRPTAELLITYWWANGLLGRIRWTPDLLAHAWAWDEQEWVDPLKEVKANADAVASRQRSIVDICASQGRDWKTVIDQNLEAERYEAERRAEMGLEKPATMDEEPQPLAKDEEDDNA